MQVNLNTSDINIGVAGTQTREEAKRTSGQNRSGQASAISVSFSGAQLSEDLLGVADERDSKSIPELRDQASGMDAGLMQDRMLLVSHGMSEEDAKTMEDEGFDSKNMDSKTTSTILDKIKAEMAKSGTRVIGYNDDLDMDKMAAILGSEGAAALVAQEFARADIPVTEDNLKIVAKAFEYGISLSQPTEGEYRYMLDNQLSANLMSFYLAESSGADQRGADLREIPKEIEDKLPEVLERDGLEANEENVEVARWLYKAGLPVTGEQVEAACDIKSVEFPLSREDVVRTAANSIANNTDVRQTSLTESRSIYEKAAELLDLYMGDKSGIEDARVLAEIRLRMTAEVNVRMLRSNFSIDTAPIEDMLEALKAAEEQIAGELFGSVTEKGSISEKSSDAVGNQIQDSVEAYRLFNKSCKIISELPDMPEDALGVAANRGESTTLTDIHEAGAELRAKYEAAGESYEKLWTAPRSDLGDRITTAFRNIENMLKEMDVEASEDNTRAVKILGRNSMEISPENIDKIKAAVREVENVLGRMTPGAVLKMIRDGVNPLETSLQDLDKYLAEKSAEYDESARDYAEYLYRVEHNGQISPEERDGYIGVFRLIHQIERGDGAAIGALVEQGAELNMSNLLAAARSGRSKGMDVKVAEGNGLTVTRYVEGESITDQISRAYRSADVKLQQTLENWGQEMTPDNILAGQQLTQNPGDLFGNILQTLGREALTKEDLKKETDRIQDEDLAELNIGEDGATEVKSGSGLSEIVEDYLKELTGEIEGNIFSSETSIQVRELQLMHKQLTLASAAVKEQEYFFPMELEGEVAGIHLKLVDGQGEGLIDITVELGEDHVEANFRVHEDQVEGRVWSRTGAKVNNLEKAVDIFSDQLSKGVVEGRQLQTHVQVNQGGFTDDVDRAHGGVQDRAVLLGVASQFLQSL